MNPQAFIDEIAPLATPAAHAVGFWPSVVIAQWSIETGWGASSYWTEDHNPAGISPGGEVASYPSIEAGVLAYVQTADLAEYDEIRAAFDFGPITQAYALGASEPVWAASHYELLGSTVQGSALVDLIEVYDLHAYDVAPAPAPPNPQPQPEEDMPPYYCVLNGTGFVVATDFSHKIGVPDSADGALIIGKCTLWDGADGRPGLTAAFVASIPTV